jgi:3-hydroxybutyryl-CoA dehydratase
MQFMSLVNRAGDWIGRTAVRHVLITAEMVDQFAALSGDLGPIHVSDAAARAQGFQARLVHGWLLGSLVSGLIGMELPGEGGVEQEVQLSFRNPCYIGDEIRIELVVAEWFESVQTLVLKVKLTRADGITLATGQIRCGLRSRDD